MLARALAAGLMCVAVSGCGRNAPVEGAVKCPPAAAGVAAQQPRTARFAFSLHKEGGTIESKVERTVSPSGAERLEGALHARQGAEPGLVLTESVTLDAAGWLRHATLRLERATSPGIALRTAELSPAAGTLRVTAGGRSVTTRIPGDQPWAYETPFGTSMGQLGVATPIAAWVAMRAASAAPTVTLVNVSAATSQDTTSDQILTEDAGKYWIVLGDHAVEADDEFVRAWPPELAPASGPDDARLASARRTAIR